MRLLDATTEELEPREYWEPNIPPYAILSHTWEGQNVVLSSCSTNPLLTYANSR